MASKWSSGIQLSSCLIELDRSTRHGAAAAVAGWLQTCDGVAVDWLRGRLSVFHWVIVDLWTRRLAGMMCSSVQSSASSTLMCLAGGHRVTSDLPATTPRDIDNHACLLHCTAFAENATEQQRNCRGLCRTESFVHSCYLVPSAFFTHSYFLLFTRATLC